MSRPQVEPPPLDGRPLEDVAASPQPDAELVLEAERLVVFMGRRLLRAVAWELVQAMAVQEEQGAEEEEQRPAAADVACEQTLPPLPPSGPAENAAADLAVRIVEEELAAPLKNASPPPSETAPALLPPPPADSARSRSRSRSRMQERSYMGARTRDGDLSESEEARRRWEEGRSRLSDDIIQWRGRDEGRSHCRRSRSRSPRRRRRSRSRSRHRRHGRPRSRSSLRFRPKGTGRRHKRHHRSRSRRREGEKKRHSSRSRHRRHASRENARLGSG
jgi:hypothetical protein